MDNKHDIGLLRIQRKYGDTKLSFASNFQRTNLSHTSLTVSTLTIMDSWPIKQYIKETIWMYDGSNLISVLSNCSVALSVRPIGVTDHVPLSITAGC